MAEKREWAGTTYGNEWMHKWLIRMLRCIDLRILYAFAALCVVPVCLVLNNSRTVTYRYFRRRIGYGVWKSCIHTYLNHILFSQVVIDKFAMYAGKRFEVDITGYEHFKELAANESGFIQLSSHMGNYEIAGYTLVAETKRFNALVFFGEKQSVMENRKKMFDSTNINMIPVRPDMGHLFEIDKALINGEIVSMPADRIFGSQKNIQVSFLSEDAKFPLGPFSIATLRGLDVIAVNVMKSGLLKYHIYVTPLPYNRDASRKQQMNELASAYVGELERVLQMYPDQWYNYFEFWKK